MNLFSSDNELGKDLNLSLVHFIYRSVVLPWLSLLNLNYYECSTNTHTKGLLFIAEFWKMYCAIKLP